MIFLLFCALTLIALFSDLKDAFFETIDTRAAFHKSMIIGILVGVVVFFQTNDVSYSIGIGTLVGVIHLFSICLHVIASYATTSQVAMICCYPVLLRCYSNVFLGFIVYNYFLV